MGSYYFGKKASTPFGDIIITPTFSELPDNPVVYINVIPLINLADFYSKKINVSPLSKQSTILTISLVDAVKLRAAEFVNTLIKKYNEDGIDEKNQVSINTAEFIAKRLDLIHEELNIVENQVASYKQSYELTDIDAEAGLFLENTVSTKKEVLKLNTELRLIQFMIDYLNENNKGIKLLPTNIGLTDISISSSVTTFNSLVNDRNRLLYNSRPENPVIQNLDSQIIDLQQGLMSSFTKPKKCNKSSISRFRGRN